MLGRHRGVDVFASSEPGLVHLAPGGRGVLANERGTIVLASRRRGLATPVGAGAGPVAAVT